MAGSIMAGVGVYAFQALAARRLGEAAYAPIGVLWTIQSLVMATVLLAAETLVAREGAMHGRDRAPVDAAVRRLLAWLVVLAAVLGGVTWLLREPLFHDAGAALPAITAVTVLTYGGFMLVRGRLAGDDRFVAYGGVTATESVTRLTAAVPVAMLAPVTTGFGWTFPLGPLPVLAWWLVTSRRARPAGTTAAPDPRAGTRRTRSTGRYLAVTGVANGAAQILLGAGPLALVALGAPAAEISVFFVTLTLARIPMMLAFGGLLSRILPPLTRSARSGDGRLRRVVLIASLATPAVGVVAGGAAALLGPWLVRLLFGAGFVPTAGLVAVLTAAVVVATAGLGLNQVLIAVDAEARIVVPWLGGVVVATLTVLAVPGTASARVAIGFLVGAAAAVAALLVAASVATRPTLDGAHGEPAGAHVQDGD